MSSVLGRRQQGVGQCFAKQPLFFGIRGGEAVTGAAKLQIPGRDNDNDTAKPSWAALTQNQSPEPGVHGPTKDSGRTSGMSR